MAISPLETLLIQKAKKEIVFVHKKDSKERKNESLRAKFSLLFTNLKLLWTSEMKVIEFYSVVDKNQ